jgi:hypothetical protein
VFAGYFDDFSLIFLHSLALFFSPPLQAKPSVACSGVIVVYYDCYCYYKYRASTWLSSIARLPSHWAASIVSTAADFFFQALRQPILQRISFDRKNTSIFISIYLSICLSTLTHTRVPPYSPILFSFKKRFLLCFALTFMLFSRP